jgi:DnaD/phage-associated family protein
MPEPSQVGHAFGGFTSGVVRLWSLPEAFVTELLPHLRDPLEIKLVLYIFWAVTQMEGDIRCLALKDLEMDAQLAAVLNTSRAEMPTVLQIALGLAVNHQALLEISLPGEQGKYYLVNTTRGQAAVAAYQQGAWSPKNGTSQTVPLHLAQPEIFRIYEENIGLLTPLLAEQLKSALTDYPAEWLVEAIQEAVKNNVRRWAYIQRILENWRERGRNG